MLNPVLRTLFAVVVCALLSAGCAATRDLLRTEIYRKEIISHSRASFFQVRAIEDRGGLRVSGKLLPRGTLRRNVPDHVDVTLVDGAGSVVAAQRVSISPRTLTKRRSHRYARFSAWFAEIPPPGTTIRVSNVD